MTAVPALHGANFGNWMQEFSGASSIDLLHTPQPSELDLFLNDDERHLAHAMLEGGPVDSAGQVLPPPAAMVPLRQRHGMAAVHHMQPAIRSASPGQQGVSWSAGSTELSSAPQLARLDQDGGLPHPTSGQSHDGHAVRCASAPRIPGMSGSPFVDDEQCLTAADTPNPFATTGMASKTGVSTNGTGSADSSGMHVASSSQPWHPSAAGAAAGWGDRPGIAANAVVRSDRPPISAHTVARSSLDSQGRCYPVVSGDPAVAAAEAAAAPAIPERNSAKQSSRRAAMLRRASLGSPNDVDTSSPRRRLLRRCKSTTAAYSSDASDSDGDNRGGKKRRVKHQPAEPIKEGTINEETVARVESAPPAPFPAFDEEDVKTLRQEIAQLRMENASAVAHIATLETERNELSRSFLSICRVLKQKAVDNQRLEAEIVKLRSAMGLASGRTSADWGQRMGGAATVGRPTMPAATVDYAYARSDAQLDGQAVPVDAAPYVNDYPMVNGAGMRGMHAVNGMPSHRPPPLADGPEHHMQYPL